MVDLPLFPLNTVLFPGGTLPLHIFEERYKLMMNLCMNEQRPFGVVLIQSGQEVGGPAVPHQVGTTARISRVQQLDGGRLNLVAVGMDRFRIESITETQPFLRADVELLQDTDVDTLSGLEHATKVTELYVEYYRLALALTNQWQDRIGLPQRAPALADFVATRIDSDQSLKQRLLETISVEERLRLERDLLTEAVAVMAAQINAARRLRYGGLGAIN